MSGWELSPWMAEDLQVKEPSGDQKGRLGGRGSGQLRNILKKRIEEAEIRNLCPFDAPKQYSCP
jgi:hypothetical protein